jgi:MFS transporter, SP family, galactose:H+ symporter
MRKIGNSPIFIIVYFALGGIIGGYLLSAIAGAAPFIIKDFSLTNDQFSTIAGLILLGGVIAKTILLVSDYFGRKTMIYLNLLLFLIGILLFTTAHTYSGLYIGRMIQGVAAIMSTVLFNVYLSEIAPSNKRGMMVLIFQLSWTAGMFIANLVSLDLAKSGNWQLMFNSILIIPIILLCITHLLPSSPRWLVLKGRLDEAKESLRAINNNMPEDTFTEEWTMLSSGSGQVDWSQSFKLLFKYKKPIFLAISVYVLTQLSGINAIMQTSVILLKNCGIQSDFMAIFGTILLSAINFIMTIGTIIFVDRIGRKKILKIGLTGFAISMIVLTVIVAILPPVALTGWLVLICMLSGIGFLAFGPTGVVYVILVEILPTPIRTLGFIIGGFTGLIVGWIFVSQFLAISTSLGYPFLFGMLAFFAIIYLLFCIFLLPETSGKTLEEIESELNK